MSVGADRDRGLLVYGGFALSLAVVIVVCKPWNLTDHFMIGAPLGRDFVNFWLGGRLALEGRLDVLVDLPAYNGLVAEWFGHRTDDFSIFSYPPHILPFLVPFGALPFQPALIVWTAINVALLAWSARLITTDRWPVMATCLSPAAMVMVTFGHFSGALAALAIFAVTRASRRPVLAGICLALISVKPQFAATLGLLMLLIGQWRAVAWSVAGAAAMIGFSILVFGLSPWTNFFNVTIPFHTWLISDFVLDHLRNTLSVYAAARLSGLSFVAAQALQLGFSLAVVAGTVMLVRRDGLNPRTVTLLLLAALAALAYFQHYDLAIVAPALSVALFDTEPAETPPFMSLIPASLLWLAPAMAIPFGVHHWPVTNLAVTAVLVMALVGEWRCRGGTPVSVLRLPEADETRVAPEQA
jgi:alpha-1,2-mannosyltransferase